jgi:uncharacterized low-complexity protein
MKKLNSVIKAVAGSALLVAVLFLFSNTSNAGELTAKGKTSLTSQKAQTSTMTLSSKFNTTNRSACGAGKCGGSDKKADAKVKTAKTKVKDAKCGAGKCGGVDKKANAKIKDAKAKVKDAKAKVKDAKCGDGKCGEGKCGSGKCGSSDKKADAKVKDAKAKTVKAKDAKCGAGKCGGGK